MYYYVFELLNIRAWNFKPGDSSGLAAQRHYYLIHSAAECPIFVHQASWNADRISLKWIWHPCSPETFALIDVHWVSGHTRYLLVLAGHSHNRTRWVSPLAPSRAGGDKGTDLEQIWHGGTLFRAVTRSKLIVVQGFKPESTLACTGHEVKRQRRQPYSNFVNIAYFITERAFAERMTSNLQIPCNICLSRASVPYHLVFTLLT